MRQTGTAASQVEVRSGQLLSKPNGGHECLRDSQRATCLRWERVAGTTRPCGLEMSSPTFDFPTVRSRCELTGRAALLPSLGTRGSSGSRTFCALERNACGVKIMSEARRSLFETMRSLLLPELRVEIEAGAIGPALNRRVTVRVAERSIG